jgi:hypothetical protein
MQLFQTGFLRLQAFFEEVLVLWAVFHMTGKLKEIPALTAKTVYL